MKTVSDRYALWVTQHRRWAFTIVALVTLVLALGASRLQINATPYFLSKSHPSRVAEQRVKKLFTNTGEQAYIAVVAHSGTVFQKPILELVSRLSQHLHDLTLTGPSDIARLRSLAHTPAAKAQVEALVAGGLNRYDIDALAALRTQLAAQGDLTAADKAFLKDLSVRIAPVKKVRSLATIENITAADDTLDVHTLMAHVPNSLSAEQRLRAEALGNPLYINGLLSRNGKATSIQVELAIDEDDSPNMIRAYHAISAILARVKMDVGLHLSGPPMIATQTASSMKHDNNTLFPGVILVVLAILYLSFRSFKATFQPLLIAILSVVWTMGTMALLGVKQNIVTTMLPVFLISIGVADSIHFLSEFRKQLALRGDSVTACKTSLSELWTPMLMTSVTTAVGFASLAYTKVVFVKDFGIFVAIGVVYAWLLTMLLLPAFSAKAKTVAPSASKPATKQSGLWFVRLSNVLQTRSGVVLILSFLLAAVAAVALVHLKVDNRVIGYFKPDARIRVDDKAFNKYFGGTTLVSLVFTADRPDAFKNLALVTAVDKIEQRLHQDPNVGYSYSIAGFVRRMNEMLHDGKPSAYALPQPAPNILSQYFLLYENGRGRDLFDVVDHRFQTARIAFSIKTDQSSVVAGIINRAMHYSKHVLPPNVTVNAAGYGDILVATTKEIVYGQIHSLTVSLILVAILMMLLFRSWQFGLLSVIPLLLTMILNFGIMSIMGVALDIGTAIVASIAVGVGVDYAIHFLNRYRLERTRCDDHSVAIAKTIEGVAAPIIVNSVALAAGFLVLTLSDYEALVHLGVLIAGTMIFSALVTLVLLPAVLTVATRRTQPSTEAHVALSQDS